MIRYLLFQSLVILILLVLVIPSISKANPTCGNFFDEGSPKSDLVIAIEKMLKDEVFIEKLDQIRRKYEGHENRKTTMFYHLMNLLADFRELPYEGKFSDSVVAHLEGAFNNLFNTLLEFTATDMPARRVIFETVGVLTAQLAAEISRSTSVEKEGNILTLGSSRIKSNADYVSARKIVFDLIDSYRIENYVPLAVRSERIQNLLEADVRYSSLPPEEKIMVASRVMRELQAREYGGIENVLEYYFTSREKERF